MNGGPVLLTVGHSTHAEDVFAGLLRSAGVTSVVDVRIAPGSRRFPQFGRNALERWLPEAGISYRWERRLEVCHLMTDGRLARHEPTPGARVSAHVLRYDHGGAAEPLPFPDQA